MAEFVLFGVPTALYLVLQSRGEGGSFHSARLRVGLTWGAPAAYGWALLLLIPLAAAGWLSIALVPSEVLDQPGVTVARLTSVSAGAGIALRAVGEEMFFRGLLSGVLIRRLGFARGNLLQAALFLVPHLSLVLIDARMWPIIPVQFAAGWLLGRLRHASNTFVPGALVHVLANIAAGLIAS